MLLVFFFHLKREHLHLKVQMEKLKEIRRSCIVEPKLKSSSSPSALGTTECKKCIVQSTLVFQFSGVSGAGCSFSEYRQHVLSFE